jgi:hypothetical protein
VDKKFPLIIKLFLKVFFLSLAWAIKWRREHLVGLLLEVTYSRFARATNELSPSILSSFVSF